MPFFGYAKCLNVRWCDTHLCLIYVQNLLEQCADEDPDTDYNKACVLYKVNNNDYLLLSFELGES